MPELHITLDKYGVKVPAELNFNAVEYFDIIDWAVCPISDPPVLKAMTDAELKDLVMQRWRVQIRS